MKKANSALKCVEQHLPFWRSRGLTVSDINIISNFLFSSHEFKAVIQVNIDSIEREEPVSWHFLSAALNLIEPNMSAPVYQSLRSYISVQKKLDEFCTSALFDVLFPSEGEFKLLQIQKKSQINERHRQTLLDQIRVFHQSRNYKVEKQTIQKFMKFYPNDKAGQNMSQGYENDDLDRFFHIYINERKRKTQQKTLRKNNEVESLMLDRYFAESLSIIEAIGDDIHSSPLDAIDGYVYFFIFLEDYRHALELWPSMQDSKAKDWLKLELLLSAHKYAEALSYLKDLDRKFQEDHSYYAAKLYAVAQCFWGLGEHQKAVELMENLIQIKPDYRLASTFLRDWRQDS